MSALGEKKISTSAAKPTGPKMPTGVCAPSSIMILTGASGDMTISTSAAKPTGPKRPIGACGRARS